MLETMQTRVMVVCILLAVLVPGLWAISCWQCNSESSKHCEDVPGGPVANVSRLETCIQEFYKECPGAQYTFCRKQVQTIEGKPRIVRSCGSQRSESECYQTRNPPIQTTVCQCDGDGCNAAHALEASILTASSVLLALLAQRALC